MSSAVPFAISPPGANTRRCRMCGCTRDNCFLCIVRIGVPCHWHDRDLCSACFFLPQSPEQLRELRDKLIENLKALEFHC